MSKQKVKCSPDIKYEYSCLTLKALRNIAKKMNKDKRFMKRKNRISKKNRTCFDDFYHMLRFLRGSFCICRIFLFSKK